MPSAQDYGTVGHLYRGIRHGLAVLAHHIGEAALFCGDPASEIGPGDAGLPGLSVITDLKSAEDAIETIIEQGEGAPSHSEDSHYSRFVRVREEYEAFLAADPDFAPAFPVAHNPTMRPPLDHANRVHVNSHEAAPVLDLANSLYGHMVRCLVQAFGRGAEDAEGKRFFVDMAIDLMEQLPPIGSYLASLPANHAHPGINAGVTFTTLRDTTRLPPGSGERRMMAERVAEIAKHARHVFPAGHELAGTAEALDKLTARFAVHNLKTVGAEHPLPAPPPPVKADDQPASGGECEIAHGRAMDVSFEGSRCIHARFCVLGAPTVFKANTPGTWIFPDTMETEALVRVAENCPSGAITYSRKDGGPAEAPPPVNLIRLRENGPYAFHGALTIDGAGVGHRATLCRCGASKNKPFCDGSHKELPFTATGEPATRESEPLAVRDGPVEIAPRDRWTAAGLGQPGDRQRNGAHHRPVDAGAALPLRRLAQQAVLRQHASEDRIQVDLTGAHSHSGVSGRRRRFVVPVADLADLVQPVVQADIVEVRQIDEDADARRQHAVGVVEGELDLGRRALCPGRIGNAPMGGCRAAGPDRAGLAGGVVADREDEIHLRRVRAGELVPALRTELADVVAEVRKQAEGVRIDRAARMAAGRIGLEAALALTVEDRLGHDRAGRIAGTDEQNIVGLVAHRAPLRPSSIGGFSPPAVTGM